MQFRTAGEGAAAYLQGSMFPSMNVKDYWKPDETIGTYTDNQGMIQRTDLKGQGDTIAQMAANDALVYEAEKKAQIAANQTMGQAQTRFATDILGGVQGFVTGGVAKGLFGGGGGGNDTPMFPLGKGFSYN